MTPIWMFEGTQELDPVAERNLVERRFSALVEELVLVSSSPHPEMTNAAATAVAIMGVLPRRWRSMLKNGRVEGC